MPSFLLSFATVQNPGQALAKFPRLCGVGHNIIFPRHRSAIYLLLSLQQNATALSHNIDYNRSTKYSKLIISHDNNVG